MPQHDVDSYVEYGPRLIAENDTHVVVAFAVAKTTIGRRMPFLAALADVATLPEPGEPPRFRR